MNPFDLTGPQFLLFYGCVGVAVCLALRAARRKDEDSERPAPALDDPYLFAALRAGGEECVRIATMALVDRNLISVNKSGRSATVLARNVEDVQRVTRGVEQAVLRACANPRSPEDLISSVKNDSSVESYTDALRRMGLLPDERRKQARLRRFTWAALVLAAISLVKIAVGLSRSRPVLFLVIETAAVIAVALVISNPRRTAAGDRLVASVRALFSNLKSRAASIRPGGATTELVWLGAVFGLAAVPAIAFPHRRLFAPQAASSGSSSSCGSSCGSSSCGGGCGGGCGGCGS
jgi:uncharacterized protein (TIGR04222 family)